MGTRIVNRCGEPYETREVRARMGFLRDELPADSGEPCTFTQPDFQMPASNRTADGMDEPPFAKAKR